MQFPLAEFTDTTLASLFSAIVHEQRRRDNVKFPDMPMMNSDEFRILFDPELGKIKAINAYRVRTDCSLYLAKKVVDHAEECEHVRRETQNRHRW